MKNLAMKTVYLIAIALALPSCAPTHTVVVAPRRPPRAVVVRRPAPVVVRPVTVVRVP
ncbi:hypothetical protein ACLI1A_17675 [Flavobacterium sp. RHBU_3]|uniref:hypothetical protein n=1 Tax=Flavobacterium sp. RHBU_3 TaxID=3391184 RepID=UPI003984A43C